MPWRPLPQIAFAVCTYPFQPSSAADLPLDIGDELYIIEQGGADGGWYRGYLVAPPSLLAGLTSVEGQTLEARVFSGIFPRACVEIREILNENRAHTLGDQVGRAASLSSQKSRRSIRSARSVRSTRRSSAANNGVLTPSRSESPPPPLPNGMPVPDNGIAPSTSRATRKSGADNLEPTSARQKSREVEGLKLSGLPPRKSIASQPATEAPLSPMSAVSRDPNAPRPPAPVPMLKIGDETPTSAQEPLVDEIASCLREWHSTKVHELLLARKYHLLDKMWRLVNRLDVARRQLLHKVLTAYELRRLRERTVWDLVTGNRMLSGEVIVRSPSQKGRILTCEDSPVELSRLQSEMSLLAERPQPPLDEHIVHHLFMAVSNTFGDVSTSTTMAINLCLKSPGDSLRPVSEVFAMDLTNSHPSSSARDASLKTLFADLSSTDIGEGAGAGSELFLVFKVLANEHFHEASGRSATPKDDPDGVAVTQQGTLRGGRRSHLWGNKQGAESGIAGVAAKDRHADYRPNSASKPKTPVAQEKKFVKRTVAAGAVRVDELMRKRDEAEETIHFWSPSHNPEERGDLDETWDDVVNELLPSVSGNYRPYEFAQPVTVSLKSFTHDDVEKLIRRTPTLLLNVNPTRKIGFSGAPTKPRSDIYITLTEAIVAKNAHLAHPKFGNVSMAQATALANLQLTLEVRRSSGERIENCIYPSCNSAGHTAWRTTAVEKGEPWNLTIRLAIAPEDVPGCHVVMSIADAPGFPFALCWMPLWLDGAFTRDGPHSLSLYSYDEYTSSMISGKGAYLALPWTPPKQGETTLTMAALHVRTYLCSTKYSQDPTLLGLLRWSDSSSADLNVLLKRFVFVPEIEIVKLLPEVFDALFEILVDYSGSAEHEDLVFSALVFVLGIVHDRRFNVGPLLEQYADTHFKHGGAASPMLRAFQRLLGNPVDPEASRKLRATFKVGAHVFKFITRARMRQRFQELGNGSSSANSAFIRELQNIFKSLESLMINRAPILIGTKTLVVQNFHTWVPELQAIMSTAEIVPIVTNFMEACSGVQGKLILFKLVLIIHIGEIEFFRSPDIRRTLVVNTAKWLAPYWGKTEVVTEQWREQVRLCCAVVASQVTDLGQEASDYIPKLVDSYRAIQATNRPPKRSLSLLFPQQYPFPSRPIVAETAFDEALVEISAVLAATTALPTLINLDLPEAELAEFLFSALQVYISVLDGDAFPKSWLSLHIFHHRAAMRTLEKLSSNLIEQFLPHPDDADQFNTELWRAFFDALLKLVGSDALALETFPEQKRRAVWKIAGDVREQGADLLRRNWEAIGWETTAEDRAQFGLEKLGGYQVQYVPGLVAPIVELCLSVHEGLRGVATSVLQTMMVSEWTLSQDLGLIQAEMIECLDRMFKTKHPTETIVQKLFISELLSHFEPLAKGEDDPLFVAVKTLVATIDELLDLLAAVHGAESVGEAFHIVDTLHLMEFLKDMHREDIYIRYVHQLTDIQIEAKNYTEAGLALRLHADLYEWDPNGLLEPLEDPDFPTQSSFERKERLYFQMIKHFEEGQSWDNALGCYIELSTQYEQNIFDFSKLARTQRAMATIYESISKGEQNSPRYFRVVYRGLGFPVALRDKHFIFQGTVSDRLESFKDRLQQQHPSAQILGAGGAEEDLEGQYLQVFPVSPQKDLLHPVYQRAKIAQSVRDYHLLARPNAFTSHTRRQGSEAGMKEQVVEKTVFTTAESFPTILRRSEVVDVGAVTLTAVQAAIERTTRKTAELAGYERRVLDGDDSAFTPLTEALMLAVDPASESSVSHYRELLPKRRGEDSDADSDDDMDDDVDSRDDEDRPPPDPLENALRVALIDHAIVLKRCLGHYSRAHQKATQADLTSRFESTFAPELEVLAPLTASSPEPTTSWIVSNSLPLPPPVGGPIKRLSARNRTSVESGGVASPPPAGQLQRGGSKIEKNRLSLAFLKRTSFFGGGGAGAQHRPESQQQHHHNYNHPGNNATGQHHGGLTTISSANSEGRTFLHSAGSSQVNDDDNSRNNSRSNNHNNHDGTAGRKVSYSAERDRDSEAQYLPRGTGGGEDAAGGSAAGGTFRQLSSAAAMNRFGSVKKRLSSLNLGRKGSRVSVREGGGYAGRPHPVMEE